LARDRRGAVMILGVFMAVLMVGFVYFVKGIGDAIVYRERMQDAADAAAFAAAAVHARGMNLVVLVNLATVGVLTVFTSIGMFKHTAMIVLTYVGVADPQVAELTARGEQAGQLWREQLYPDIARVLRAASTASSAIAVAIPAAAEARALDLATAGFRPPVTSASSYPAFGRLPVADATLEELGDRVAAPADAVVRLGLQPYPTGLAYFDANPALLPDKAAHDARLLFRAIGQDGMLPKRAADDLAMGDDALQLRVVVGGAFDFALSERGVAIAAWGEEDDGDADGLAALAQLAVAQAEYFHEPEPGRAGDAGEWLWSPRWRARMRRVRLPAEGAACAPASAACDALEQLAARGLGDALVH
jgi:hypothetical protein